MFPPSEIASHAGVKLGELLAGKYRVESVIGEGGMGIVLGATHVDLDCKVAIKLVRAELAEREEAVERMMLEARAAAKIRSEHVARVLDVGRVDSGAPFIVMEFLEGSDLCSVLEQQGPMHTSLAIDLILQACEAIAEAHAAGIVHRDLKPENLFLTARADGTPVVKVLDFGISKQLNAPGRKSSWTNPSSAIGSPHYMAPEQMRRASEVDARADIWALGAILYELLTRVSPFEADTIPAVCARVLGDDPTPLRELVPELPAGLEAAVARCLEKSCERRFASVSELAFALAPFGSELATLYAERVARVALGRVTPVTFARASLPSPIPTSLAPAVITRPPTFTLGTLPSVQRRRRSSKALGWVAGATTLMLAAAGGVWLLGAPLPRFVNLNEGSALAQPLAPPASDAPPASKGSEANRLAVPSQPAVVTRGPELPAVARGAEHPTAERATQAAPARVAARLRRSNARRPAPAPSAASEEVAPQSTDDPVGRDEPDAWSVDSFGGRR